MMVADPWHLCARHARWSDNSRDPQTPWIDVADWPQILAAERQRVAMVRCLGRTARALFADARTMSRAESSAPDRLRVMADRLGEARAASLLLYPHTVRIARVLAQAERRRLGRELTADSYEGWFARSSQELGPRYRGVLRRWMECHKPVPGPEPRRRGELGRAVLVAPHTRIAPLDSTQQLSCLPSGPVASPFDRPFL
ncbi:hypothetical protein [Peterkaempfera bronchialis]|uniref:Uncharacterized protein n=1 Tax=Peterkaempfera bronchialis TaxID=2126346 RepID=A0A345SQW4_9ACTN|nr:hypothetical protein [Peterkaempfera bronchialis]AXI76119.1 hypothetical protein C7M71_000085 [Peterkaempfera bronchialis]